MDKRKDLKELNLLDKFLFDEAVEDPEFLETVLSIILDHEVTLTVFPQTEKEQRRRTNRRKIQLDVWSQDTEKTIYDTEVQNLNTGNLPKRFRLYHALIDSNLLPSGTRDFNLLNDVVVIIIAPFDLFGLNKYRYTFRMRCDEEKNLELNDGAVTIFLNTHGTNKDGVTDELIDLLHYFEDSSERIAADSDSSRIKMLHKRIRQIRDDEKVGIKYMN